MEVQQKVRILTGLQTQNCILQVANYLWLWDVPLQTSWPREDFPAEYRSLKDQQYLV